MKINWIIISLTAAIVGGIITYLLVRNLNISIISSVIIFILGILGNPKRRFMKAFWAILSMFLILNRFFFEIVGELFDFTFKIGSPKIDYSISIILLVLAGFTLYLDYKERKEKNPGKKIKFLNFNFKWAKIGDGSNDNYINQK